MSVIFKTISYQNIKTVGNSPIVIDLNKSQNTLITGKNGSGKSTLISAFCFGLFGRDYGSITKPALVNSINQKKLLVEISFSIGSKDYKVRRGIKPNIFEIYENETLLNQDASSRDYQKILENQILKMNYRSFTQACVIGSSEYIPFMKLSVKERRDFIEELLDIKIFSAMGTLLKDTIKKQKQEMELINAELKSTKEKIELQESFIKKLKDEKSVSAIRVKETIASFESVITGLENDYETVSEKVKDLTEKLKPFSGLTKEVNSIENEIDSLERTKNSKEKKKSSFENMVVCPTCNQSVDETHKHTIISEYENEMISIDSELSSLLSKMKALQTKVGLQEKINTKVTEFQNSMNDIQQNILIESKMKRAAESQLKIIETSEDDSLVAETEKKKSFLRKYIAIEKNKKDLIEKQQYHDYVSSILTDSGIKAKIIKQYIPAINKLINHYLSELDFFVSFHLDEEFKETVKSRYRDTFTYDNFSAGQKARIDIALMFAWRDIARMRNSVSCNLLILDEADANMDGEGASLLSDLLSTMKSSNVIVISHKADVISDKYEKVIKMVMEENFTTAIID